MDDSQIVDLYFARSETAIQETDSKYGGYCYKIAYGILASREDSEESVSDTYLSAWNCIPPRRPARLSTFLGKLTRNISKAAAQPLDNRMTTKGQPSGCRSGNRGKVRLGKVSIAKASIGACTKAAGPPGHTSSPLHFFRIVI